MASEKASGHGLNARRGLISAKPSLCKRTRLPPLFPPAVATRQPTRDAAESPGRHDTGHIPGERKLGAQPGRRGGCTALWLVWQVAVLLGRSVSAPAFFCHHSPATAPEECGGSNATLLVCLCPGSAPLLCLVGERDLSEVLCVRRFHQ
jgi:hypothetical protein